MSWVLTAILVTSCQRQGVPVPVGERSLRPALQARDTPSVLPDNELIWAGLAGNPPRFIDSGENQGLGYIEVQTNVIRKALLEAGFNLKYEYFSSARIAHELSRRSPICFYPVEWKDPKRTFQKAFKESADRIYSIALDFSGEETRSIVIRKQDEGRFAKFIGKNGNLNLKDLLKDPSLKTLLPRTDGIPKEFDPVYRTLPDGSIEITEPYRTHVSTRVLRENHQLIQMLNGGRFDYLLEPFITAEDYKVIREGLASFKLLSYESRSIRSLSDPELIQTSVVCGIHPTTQRAMPVINRTIRALRSPVWSHRVTQFREHFEPGSFKPLLATLAYRFSADIAAGKADQWYPLQFQNGSTKIELPPPSSASKEDPPLLNSGEGERAKRAASWLALFPDSDSVWILSKADAIDLSSQREQGFTAGDNLRQSSICLRESHRAWSQKQLASVQSLAEQSFESDNQGTFEEVFLKAFSRATELKSISIFARGLTPSQAEQMLPLLSGRKVTQIEVVSAPASVLKEILPLLPKQLEELNLFGSDLGDQRLMTIIPRMRNLKQVNFGCMAMDPADYFDSLLALPPSVTALRLDQNTFPWPRDRAIEFGKKSFPTLEVLNFENNDLDDRHCGLLRRIPSSLRQLNLNGNLFTSECLSAVLHKPLPALVSLKLALARISNKKGSRLKLPPSVRDLDLSLSLSDETMDNLELPVSLKSLFLRGTSLGEEAFRKLAKHLSPRVEVLALSDSPSLGLGVMSALTEARIEEIEDLRLANVDLALTSEVRPRQGALIEESFKKLKVGRVDLSNTRFSNQLLRYVSSYWGPSLEAISLRQNLLSASRVAELLQKSSRLKNLDLSFLPEIDVGAWGEHLPKNLRSLNLAGNGLTDQDLAVILPRLPQSLSSLDLSLAFFSRSGAKLLAEAFQRRLSNLSELTLLRSFPEGGWVFVLGALPPDLRFLEFGPASLSDGATSHFLSRLPKGLSSMRFEQVQLTAHSLDQFLAFLPGGLLQVRFSLDSFFSGLSGVQGPSGRAPFPSFWPEALKILAVDTSKMDSDVLSGLINALPQTSTCGVFIKSPNTPASAIGQYIQKAKGYVPIMSLTGATIVPEVLLSLNRVQPSHLFLSNAKFKNTTLAGIDSRVLSQLKSLRLVGVGASSSDILALLERLPPNMYEVSLNGTQLKYSDLDRLIRVLPKGLFKLNIGGTLIGPKGNKRLKEYSAQLKRVTGFALLLDFK